MRQNGGREAEWGKRSRRSSQGGDQGIWIHSRRKRLTGVGTETKTELLRFKQTLMSTTLAAEALCKTLEMGEWENGGRIENHVTCQEPVRALKRGLQVIELNA